MTAVGQERIEKARARLGGKSPAERRQLLRTDWGKLLGPVTPAQPPAVKAKSADDQPVAGARVERLILETEPGIVVPVVVLTPVKRTGKAPVVIGLAQGGKAAFLKDRAGELHKLIQGGTAVVLPDLRGIGETHSGGGQGQSSTDTNLSTHVELFGETLLGERLRDLRSVLAYLRTREDIDAKRLGLWGDSLAPSNPPDTNYQIPYGVDGRPRESEPLGGLLGLLGALFEDDVRAVYVAGGLVSYHSVLSHYAVLIPHGCSVPGALTAGDLCDLAGSLAPRPLRLEALVDHLNRPLTLAELTKAYGPAVQNYAATPRALGLADSRSSAANWMLEQLK
jgi:hypothetical protein